MTKEKRSKIVVFGAFGAGKTTLVNTLDPGSTHVEADCAGGTTTVALDFGRVFMDGHHLYDSLVSAKIPFVVFLNKCDTIGARPEIIEKEFHAAVIRKVSVKDRKQCLEAVCTFAQTLPPHPDGYGDA
jgi:signal recognition particle receptor subunit beta